MLEIYSLHLEVIMRVMELMELRSSRIRLASRGFRDSIGDIEYEQGNIRIGLQMVFLQVSLSS